jgi:hypothetical protein
MKIPVTFFRWIPRILCILAILFISMFALDSFEPGQTIWQQLAAFAMHLIPSFILIAVLLLAWKWELTGGVIFLLIGISLSPFIFSMNYHNNHSIWMSLGIILLITFPFVVVGVLFIISHFVKRKYAQQT